MGRFFRWTKKLRFLDWVQSHSPELAFLVAGGAAIDAGWINHLGQPVPPIIGTIMTTFGGIAIAQWNARRQEAKATDDDDDDEPRRAKRRRKKHPAVEEPAAESQGLGEETS